MSDTLITRYRPRDFDEIIGHYEIVASLRRALASPSHPHAYLLTGGSGLGKTTLARIIGNHIGAEILEIDAASNSGVDDMRELVELGSYIPISGAKVRMVIIDECHVASKTAFQALLKILEEPPSHLYFALCTTELQKVPETIVQRCYHAQLKPVKPPDLEDLLIAVTSNEGWQCTPEVRKLIIQAAQGSPRKALAGLQAVHDTPLAEAQRVIGLLEAGELVELCRLLLHGGATWAAVRKAVARVEDDEWDKAATLVAGYMSAVMLRSEDEKTARRAWTVLDALTFPAQSWDRKATFITAIGRILWGS